MINEISFKLPSQLLVHKKHVSKIPASFDDNFYQLSMNNRIKAAKFEPEPTFENTINDIKDNHLKIIASATINISAITLFEDNLKQLSMNSSIEVAKFEPEPTFENTTNDIKDNHLKFFASTAMNLSDITFFTRILNILV